VSRPLPTVLAAVVSRWDGPVVAAVEGSRRLTVARRCADLADLLSAAGAGLGRVALVSGQLRGLTLSAVASLRESGVEVVGLAEPDDESDELRLWQLGVHAVVSATAPPDELIDALLAAAGASAATGSPAPGLLGEGSATSDASAGGADRAPQDGPDLGAAEGILVGTPPPTPAADLPQRHTPGRLLVVWGPTGAPGRTSVAVNLAAELAVLGRQVLLVDADTYGGSVAQTLALLDEAPGIAAAARLADQGLLDVSTMSRQSLEVRPRLRVLTGIARAQRWTEIRGAALERVLQVCRGLADIVVVDVGFCLEDDEELSYDTQAPRRNEATLTALQSADAAIAVGGCDPLALQRLIRGLEELGTVRAPTPLVVVNRLRSGPVGSPPERRVADALARFAGITEVVTIPDDPVAFDAGMLAGRALAEIVPTSAARRALAELARRVALEAAVPDSDSGVAAVGAATRAGRTQGRAGAPAGPRSGGGRPTRRRWWPGRG